MYRGTWTGNGNCVSSWNPVPWLPYAFLMAIQTPTSRFRHRVRHFFFFRSVLSFACQQLSWLNYCKERTFRSHCVGWSMWPAITGSNDYSVFSPSTCKHLSISQLSFVFIFLSLQNCQTLHDTPCNIHVLRMSTARSFGGTGLREGREREGKR